jgi:prepilin-type N-terminal cleavage/methylation domain-containing protein/prepilin-type processing-associated H-X9-DG protein
MLDIPLRSRENGAGDSGFTLLELLVVIAIMTILAGILFPVFARAGEKARQSACASNIKNLGVAILLYAQDYDEQFPLAAYATSAFDFLTWHDLTDPYAKNKEIWHCPSSPLNKADVDGRITTHFGYNARYLTTIALDFSNAKSHSAVSLAGVGSPAETVLLTDARASLQPSWCGDDGKFLLPPSEVNAHCWGRPNFLHNEGSNVLWVDGHIKWQQPNQFYGNQMPVDRYFDRR